jgi:protein arginine kinase activator
MKCQKCEKPATFHITELTGGKPQELHLCEEHVKEYLMQSGGGEPSAPSDMAAAIAQHVQQLAIGQTAEEMARLNQQTCPFCGISFLQFRNQGRLGCPHDYIAFAPQLDALLLNIHGETEHVGKVPKRSAGGSEKRMQLIRLRREMNEAVGQEEYERASRLRDDIRRIEEGEA